MRIAPVTGGVRPPLTDSRDSEEYTPILLPPTESDQAPRTIEEEIKIREERGLPVPPSAPTTFPNASPPIVPPTPPASSGGWAFAAALAAYFLFG